MVERQRTVVVELDVEACWELLRQAQVGRLAMAVGGEVEIFPVNFLVDAGSLVFRTDAGTKLATIVSSGRVAMEVDGYDPDSGTAWSVVAKGRAHEISRVQDHLAALSLPLFPWIVAPLPRFVRVEPTKVTGRSFTALLEHAPRPRGRVPRMGV